MSDKKEDLFKSVIRMTELSKHVTPTNNPGALRFDLIPKKYIKEIDKLIATDLPNSWKAFKKQYEETQKQKKELKNKS